VRKSRRRVVLALGDAAALTLFAVIGLLSHDKGVSAAGLARNALPILAGWFAAAAVLRLYVRGGGRARVLARAVGATGWGLRLGLILGRSVDTAELTFWAVTMAVTFALVAAWRLIALWLRVRPGTSLRR